MVCALTSRHLRPGTFEQFREAFMAPVREGRMPAGWVRFAMVRGIEDDDEVICFGIFDCSAEELKASAALAGYEQQQAAIEPFVEFVGVDQVYEVVEQLSS